MRSTYFSLDKSVDASLNSSTDSQISLQWHLSIKATIGDIEGWPSLGWICTLHSGRVSLHQFKGSTGRTVILQGSIRTGFFFARERKWDFCSHYQ